MIQTNRDCGSSRSPFPAGGIPANWPDRERACSELCWSVERREVLGPALYRVDEFFGPVVPDQRHEFEQPASGIKPQTEKMARICIVQRDLHERP